MQKYFIKNLEIYNHVEYILLRKNRILIQALDL